MQLSRFASRRLQKVQLCGPGILIVLVVLAGGIQTSESAQKSSPAKVDSEHAKQMAKGLVLFKKDVRQILVRRCVKCHGGEDVEGEFNLATRKGLLKGGSEGISVISGKAKASRLYQLIAHLKEPHMPYDKPKLPQPEIKKIAAWIDLGAPYDAPLVDVQAQARAWTTRKVPDESRQWWAFRQFQWTNPSKSKWTRTPIDGFVLARLEQRGLAPNPAASKRKLIRRAFFDLIGLPPTPEQVQAFLKDDSTDAYENLIDRLLKSEHYGERWGRHWLDVARFAESHGFEQDYDRPHAYHFRDFVIKALNQDMPYDQFVRWQLAGDEIEPSNPLAMMATGFLGAGVFPTQLTEKEFEPARYDELDDMVNTLGTAMLGLTIGCARCHDHKFDPIPSGDYYRMISTFTTTIRSNIELNLDPKTTRRALAKWEEEHHPLVAALETFEQKQLPQRFQKWLAAQLSKRPTDRRPAGPKPAWLVLDLVDYKSHGGATFTKLDDGSLLAGGNNPNFDKYTFVAHTDFKRLTAIRLEALSHPSMVKGGPGRAANGNFGLGNFTLAAEPLRGKGQTLTAKLVDPQATFQQNTGNLSIAASIDDKPKTGWAVDPQFGKDHAAVFEIADPLGFDGGTKLTFTLAFDVNNKHNIGRPRLSFSTAPRPVGLKGDSQPQAVVEALALLDKTNGKLTKPQRQKLLLWYRTTDPDWRKLNQKLQDHVKAQPKPKLTKVMVTSEGFKPIKHNADGRGFPHFYKKTYFLKRGDTGQKQGVAKPSFLQVLMAAPKNENRWQVARPKDIRTSYRRRALANWITDTEHGAGRLLARVIVNRLWQHHMGRGIVATPNDFGVQGQRPTHPELLDWLAGKLIESGWRLKPLHKLIMTSAAYMQSAEYDKANAKIDPENRWCWRYQPRRLEAEIIRDSMLAVSGQLDRRMFGPGTLDEGTKRRSIYFMIKRSKLVPMMQLFDSPEPLASVGNRPSTTIAPQALLFMNNPRVRSYARSFAQRLASAADKSLAAAVRRGYLIAVAREPTNDEFDDSIRFLHTQMESYTSDKKTNPRELALADFCQVLLSLNEFVYVE